MSNYSLSAYFVFGTVPSVGLEGTAFNEQVGKISCKFIAFI